MAKAAKKSGKALVPAKPGRPSSFTPAIAAAICAQIAEGASLRSICADKAMPAMRTVFMWLADPQRPTFVQQYAIAREEQAETLADEIVAISDEECTMVRADKHPGAKPDDDDGNVEVVFDSTAVARNRLRVDARKWVASKLKPKKYGERIQHANDPDSPMPAAVTITLVRPD